jgi:hypothetical protein
MLGFELRVDGHPFIADTGTSTYEPGERRLYERGTAAHNTVSVDGRQQSEIWSSFRVARRARMQLEEDRADLLRGRCRYYGRRRVHRRDFRLSRQRIVIEDTAEGERKQSTAYFHLAPEAAAEGPQLEEGELCSSRGRIRFQGAERAELRPCLMAAGFGRLEESLVIVVRFRGRLRTEIDIE